MAEEPSPAGDKIATYSFNTAFGTEIIRLVVGLEKKVYRIHKSKLCSKIPLLITKIEQSKNPRESDEGVPNEKCTQVDRETVINFPEGNIASWDILLKWVYHATLPTLTVDRKGPSGWSWNPFIFYALTDSLCLHSLSDTVMSLLQSGQAKAKLWHSNETLSWTWVHTKPGCGMRKYLALSLARSIMVYKDPKDVDPKKKIFTMETKEIADMLGALPDLLVEVLGLMRGMDGVKAKDPRIADPCEFHAHWPRKLCGYDLEGNAGEDGEERKRVDTNDEESKAQQAERRAVRFKETPSYMMIPPNP